MSTCQSCSLNIRSQQLSVSCRNCSRTFHGSCVNITANDVAYMEESGDRWLCENCRGELKRRQSVDDSFVPLTRSGSTGSKSGSRGRVGDDTTADVVAGPPSCAAGGGASSPVTLVSLMERLDSMESSFSSQITELKSVIVDLRRQLQDQADKNSELLKEVQHVRALNGSLRDQMAGPDAPASSSASHSAPRMFSSVVSQRAAVVIKPKNINQANSRTKVDLLRSVNPVVSEVAVTGVKHISNGGLVVSCSSSDGASRLSHMARAKLSESYDIKEAPKMHPRIRLVGMTEKHEGESLIDFLKTQNPDLFGSSQISLISFGPLRKSKNVFQAVLQVDALAFKRSVGSTRVFVGYDCCAVYDALEVVRCFNCCGFHHISSRCKNRAVCPRCAGEHLLKDCKSQILKCVNCFNVNKLLPEVAFDHAAWDHACPSYKKKLASLRTDIFGPE